MTGYSNPSLGWPEQFQCDIITVSVLRASMLRCTSPIPPFYHFSWAHELSIACIFSLPVHLAHSWHDLYDVMVCTNRSVFRQPMQCQVPTGLDHYCWGGGGWGWGLLLLFLFVCLFVFSVAFLEFCLRVSFPVSCFPSPTFICPSFLQVFNPFLTVFFLPSSFSSLPAFILPFFLSFFLPPSVLRSSG